MAEFAKNCVYPGCVKVFTTTAVNAKYCVPHRKKINQERNKALQEKYREEGRDHPERHAELSKKEALEFFSQEKIEPAYLRERLYELTLLAARAQGVPAEKKFYKNLIAIRDLDIPGELVSLKVLRALWLTSSLYYEQGWRFSEFLSWRKNCKKDAVLLGKFLGKNFQKEPHGDWSDFLPAFNPEGLRRNYNQEDMRLWLRSQLSKMEGSKRDFLLMCARNHYKSTYIRIWAITGTLCCPDLRFLVCSKIQPVVKDWFDEYRPYWELGSGPQNEPFQNLFPEYMVKPQEGKSYNFESPMAHLNLAQKSAQLTSVDSGSTGTRFDVLIADDVVDQDNTDQETQRKKVVRRYDAIWKLREVGGITITIGTPQHPEDLYAELLKRAEKGQEIAIHLSPAWVIVNEEIKPRLELPKGHPSFFDIHNVKFEDVKLMFPLRNFTAHDTFLWLMGELGKTSEQERDFRCQYLIQWVAEDKEDTLNFEETKLRAAVIHKVNAPEGDTVLTLDTAYSQSRYADNSALSVVRLAKNSAGVWALYVLDQDAGHWKVNDKAEKIAVFWQKYQPRIVWAEKAVDSESIDRQLMLEASKRGIQGRIPVFWLPVDNAKAAKFKRIKACESLLPDRLKFVSGEYVEPLFDEAKRLDGKTSSMTSRNDRWDTISLAARIWKVELAQFQPTNEADLQKVRDQQIDDAWRKMEYDLHFQRVHSAPILMPPVEEGQVDTRRAPLVDAGKRILGSGFRI